MCHVEKDKITQNNENHAHLTEINWLENKICAGNCNYCMH